MAVSHSSLVWGRVLGSMPQGHLGVKLDCLRMWWICISPFTYNKSDSALYSLTQHDESVMGQKTGTVFHQDSVFRDSDIFYKFNSHQSNASTDVCNAGYSFGAFCSFITFQSNTAPSPLLWSYYSPLPWLTGAPVSLWCRCPSHLHDCKPDRTLRLSSVYEQNQFGFT